ncbi:hypothetical protein [Sulfobacillus harzensis]|uniref:Uncharacterized protein n=1 Tax=Sulfobacillus harzensis TaxID=2729629 RepID=A0A7Y0Q3Q0_9FIRM|nr:hypothetical protein [Sulfobacillus harzensis]NMP23762.1 hypothetical protein [Sulfobacillus harzensis]
MERHEALVVIGAKFFSERQDTNPYASAETMRAFDQVIRNSLGDGLARAASVFRTFYQEQSRVIGIPTRERPFPDPGDMAKLRYLKRIADQLSEWVSRIHALEAPSNDRVYHRIRDNDQLLELLIDVDYQLAQSATEIDRMTESLNVSVLDAMLPKFERQLEVLGKAVRERSRIISGVV